MGLAASTSETLSTKPADDFRLAVDALRALCDDDLAAVNTEILARMDSPVKMIPEIAGHLINAGGKRIRPMMTIAAARILGYQGHHHVELAAAVELIHGATLLHDDVVDESALRRGAETANIIWGNKESVLVGDFIFSRAFELMVAAEDLRVLEVLSRASGVIAEGEVLQLTTQKNVSATVDMYLAVVEAKTAALFAAAAQSGALIADAPRPIENALREYGLNLGIAYQLIDDALDYAGFENALGKTVGDDFREGKMTLPVVYAIARATSEEKSFWTRVIGEGDQRPGDFEKACTLMKECNAISDTIDEARAYAKNAHEALGQLPQNEFTSALGDLVDASVSRAY